ncbi:MAG: hypothetical protein QM747_14005 [Nocardioides sp.]
MVTKTKVAAEQPPPVEDIDVTPLLTPAVDRDDEVDQVVHDESADQPPVSVARRTTVVTGFLVYVAVGLVVALVNDGSRTWIVDHWAAFLPATVLTLAVVVVAFLGLWAKTKSSPLRAAVYLLVVFPAAGLGTAGIFWMPTAAQLVTLRAVVLCVLVFTPVLMWWLFIATQRASLLNEFIANLDRLGLLREAEPDGPESACARETRISSYLQKFEATYGRLPQKIFDDVVRGTFRSYSSDETKDRTSLSASAVPVTLTLVTLLVGWILVLPPVDSFPGNDHVTSPRWLLALSPNATPVTFAFLGAYFFSLQMLFRRYVRGDLRGSAYVAVVLRVVLAVVGIWVLQGIGGATGWTSTSQLLTLGFVIGVFPVVVWQVLSGVASKTFHFALPSLESRLPLSELNGLTVWHEARLEEEDVENVQNMATADIVDLLVNTRIPVPRLVDWIDQAILLSLFGPEGEDKTTSPRHRLGQHGIRTASALLETAARTRPGAEATFDGLVTDDAGNPAMPSVLASLRTNDNLVPILRWRGRESLLSA